MYRLRALIFVTFGTLAASAASQGQVTEIYKCMDAAGRPLYTSDKKETAGKKCELVSSHVNVAPIPAPAQPNAAKPAAKSPGNFPKESPEARASAKERQREILEKELSTEQGLLAQAKKELSQQETQRSGEEKNFARVLERLQPYKDKVEVHEKNIQALRRELANLNR
jgi:hypothetical protein